MQFTGLTISGGLTIERPPAYPATIELLVVAGGGSGQNGGGGGGGLVYDSAFSISSGSTYTVTVGAGGSSGAQGSNSVFSTTTAIGGGYGSVINYPNAGTGGNGGSGGGGSPPYYSATPGQGGKGVYPGSTYVSAARQGYDGGQSAGQYYNVGGFWLGGSGGGAGGPGEAPSYLAPWAVYDANGGPGLSYFGSYYAGGGAGGDNNTGVTTKGTGGLGGGGNTASSGTVNTGGGGGGDGGNGGSGVVIVRYPDNYGNASVTGSPTLTISGGYKLYTFTSSGSITF